MTFFCRFSSGDLSSECDDVDPNEASAVPGTSKPPPLQSQPMPGGPPNIPPPPGNNVLIIIISLIAFQICKLNLIHMKLNQICVIINNAHATS